MSDKDTLEKLRELLSKIIAANKGNESKVARLPFSRLRMGFNNQPWIVASEDDELWETLVSDLQSMNSDMLSINGAEDKLAELVVKIQANQWANTSLDDDIAKLVSDIKRYKTQDATVWIPILDLGVEDGPLTLGNVIFESLIKGDEIDQTIKSYVDKEIMDKKIYERINCIAKTTAHGDGIKVEENGKQKVESALNVLNAFLILEIIAGRHGQVGSTCTWQESSYTIIRGSTAEGSPADKPLTSKMSFGRQGIPFSFNSGIRKRLQDRNFDAVHKILQKPEGNRTPMEEKLLRGLYWLGESVLPDISEAKFVKIAFALEAMIGGNAKGVSPESQKSQLAERAAFIINGSFKNKKAVDKVVKKYVGQRNEIAHGGSVPVSMSDIYGFSRVVLTIAIKLLELLNNPEITIRTVDELHQWVLEKRYS